MVTAEEVLAFWLDEIGTDGWYAQSDELDARIIERFKEPWITALNGGYSMWLTYPSGALAYLILTDQFPRNMFRGQGASFATDRTALAAAKVAISKKWDMRIDEPARQFFYLPLMHSESTCDQDRCVRLICERMPEGRDSNLFHAKAHREVIREFGRFPYRNEALGRKNTAEETAYLKRGGYGYTVRSMQGETEAA